MRRVGRCGSLGAALRRGRAGSASRSAAGSSSGRSGRSARTISVLAVSGPRSGGGEGGSPSRGSSDAARRCAPGRPDQRQLERHLGGRGDGRRGRRAPGPGRPASSRAAASSAACAASSAAGRRRGLQRGAASRSSATVDPQGDDLGVAARPVRARCAGREAGGPASRRPSWPGRGATRRCDEVCGAVRRHDAGPYAGTSAADGGNTPIRHHSMSVTESHEPHPAGLAAPGRRPLRRGPGRRRTRRPATGLWRAGRDDLLARHPDTPLLPEDRAGFAGLPGRAVRPGPAVRGRGRPRRRAAPARGADRHRRRGAVRPGRRCCACPGSATWTCGGSTSYGGGVFVPVKDALAGQETYGGGRYLLDTVKGADLGGDVAWRPAAARWSST